MIECKRSFDNESIYQVIEHCFDDIVEDGTDGNCIDFDVNAQCWLEFRKFGVLLGYMQFAPYNRTTLDIHPYIIRDYRRYSIECGKMAIDFFNQDAPEMYKKLISQVPSCYPHIKRYTLSLGFELEGTHKKAFLKHGKLRDLWLFGYERAAK